MAAECNQMSVKEMYDLSKKHYDNLPEIKQKRENQKKQQEKLVDLKCRMEKVKLLDDVSPPFFNS